MARINPDRDRILGSIGEKLAISLLTRARFENIQNLNDLKKNFPFGDIIAERNGKKFVISVKARNKRTVSGKLNARYTLGDSHVYDLAAQVAKMLSGTPAFLAIQVDNLKGCYSGYFGELTLLNGNRGIAMDVEHLIKYECLGKNIKSDFDYWQLKNDY
jgi:hypothetical protein